MTIGIINTICIKDTQRKTFFCKYNTRVYSITIRDVSKNK